jgi:hypothetical protein
MMALYETAGVITEDGSATVFVSETFSPPACGKTPAHGRFVLIDRDAGSGLEVFDLE